MPPIQGRRDGRKKRLHSRGLCASFGFCRTLKRERILMIASSGGKNTKLYQLYTDPKKNESEWLRIRTLKKHKAFKRLENDLTGWGAGEEGGEKGI